MKMLIILQTQITALDYL